MRKRAARPSVFVPKLSLLDFSSESPVAPPEETVPWGFVEKGSPPVLDFVEPKKEPKRQALPLQFSERERRIRRDMAQASARPDTSYGYEQAHAKELAMHERLVRCGIEDDARHRAALAHIARAQDTFLANLHKRRATTGLQPLVQPVVQPLVQPVSAPASFLRNRRALPEAAASEAEGIDRIKARFATFVELQNESRRRMLADEMRNYAKQQPPPQSTMCI